MAYVVATPIFNGPIELLLSLISNHEIDILEIELAPVVDAFVREIVNTQGELPMDQLSDFLLVAAILLELKSQRLLPGPDEIEGDDELVGWEERDLLLARLFELRAYAAAADLFAGLIESASKSIPRSVGLTEGFQIEAPDLLADVTTEKLLLSYLRAVEVRPVEEVDISHMRIDSSSVAETVTNLVRDLPKTGTTSFRTLVANLENRLEIIVHFLAVLELCKLGRVSLGQGITFGDLTIAWLDDEKSLYAVSDAPLEVDTYDG